LSPLGEVHVESGDRLCALDLARSRGVGGAGVHFAYSAHTDDGTPLPVAVGAEGAVCVALPRTQPVPREPLAPRYRGVALDNGAARAPLLAHLYDLGARGGYRLVGVERPEQAR
jgi:hypothetical protein